MPEDREYESPPYPKMEITFHRRDESFGKGGGIKYVDIITAKMHFLVKYRCCFCGAENRDETQFFQIEEYTKAFDPQTRIEKETQTVREIKTRTGKATAAEMERNIKARAYENLGLRCRCTRCGKKQPWSKFWQMGGILKAIGSFLRDNSVAAAFLVGMVVVGIPLLGWAIEYTLEHVPLRFRGIVLIGIVLLPLAAKFAEMAHNMRIKKKSLKLEEEYRPEISIVYRSD